MLLGMLELCHTHTVRPALASQGVPTIDLPALAVAWGLATWWAARWISPSRGTHGHPGGSPDGPAQEPVHPGRGEQHRGGQQREEHHPR